MIINGYTLTTELTNANSGFSKWAFATKNGKHYFIKELIQPVYPMDKSVMSDAMFQEKRKYCAAFEQKFKDYFNRINTASRGNLVRIEEFFRCDSRYYLVSEKIHFEGVTIEGIAASSELRRRLLLNTVAHCFYDLHTAGIVHFDVKPNNIMVKRTMNGNFTAKVIDFDSGFLKGNVPDDEEIGGDLVYLAPETFMAICGEDVEPDEKADIFALGLIFHQYYCGTLPPYDESEYDYPYEAALDTGKLEPDRSKIPAEIADIIAAMLDTDPTKRPSAAEILQTLHGCRHGEKPEDFQTISIHFGGAYGKTILLSPDFIRYQNTIHPSVATQAAGFPSSYTEQKEKPLSAEEFQNLLTKVLEGNMFDILLPYHQTDAVTHEVSSELVVTLTDGATYRYSTTHDPGEIFDRIADILSAECDFPSLDQAWITGSIPTTPPPGATTNASGSWFNQAGSL